LKPGIFHRVCGAQLNEKQNYIILMIRINVKRYYGLSTAKRAKSKSWNTVLTTTLKTRFSDRSVWISQADIVKNNPKEIILLHSKGVSCFHDALCFAKQQQN